MQTALAPTRRRKNRVWAPTTDGAQHLGRSARQLAKNSASRISQPAVAACLKKYRLASALEQSCKLLRGDLLVELIDGHGLRAIDIARETGERPADLSNMYRTARAFPPGSRPQGVAYNILMLAGWMTRKFPQLSLTPLQAAEEITRAGLSQHRDVTSHFAALSRKRVTHRIVPAAPPRSDQLINHAHHCRFQDLRSRFADGSIQLLSFDPPYVYGDQTYRSRSARSLACDNDDPRAAVAQTTDLLRDWQPTLALGGVVLLWQPWQNLLPSIADAIRESQWEMIGPVVWDKGRPQPGSFDSPYSVQGEMLWVLHRPGERPINHDDSPRRMILSFPPVSFPSLADNQDHGYEKPVNLCEFLIRKHTRPGDLIFDACGCTGSMSVAAINCGRNWVYAESNADNYRTGAARIAQKLAQTTPAAS